MRHLEDCNIYIKLEIKGSGTSRLRFDTEVAGNIKVLELTCYYTVSHSFA
jgi:hypothetical protein